MRHILSVFFVSASMACASGAALAGEPQPRTITVGGQGEVFAEPDLLLTSLYVQERGKDVKVLKDNIDAKIRKIKDLLKAAEIDDKDVRIMQLNVQPRYDWSSGAQKFLGYEVRRDIEIRLKKIENFGKLLDGAIAAGVNHTGYVQLTNQNFNELETEAAVKAVKAAHKKAALLAEAAGAKVGRVLSIHEDGGYAPPPMPMLRNKMATMSMEAADAAPVESAGQNSIRKSVSVVFELQ